MFWDHKYKMEVIFILLMFMLGASLIQLGLDRNIIAGSFIGAAILNWGLTYIASRKKSILNKTSKV